MSTTINIARMNSRLTADWLEKVIAGHPALLLPNGNIRLPPARGSFVFAAEPSKDKLENGVNKKGNYGASLLWPVVPNLDALTAARAAAIRTFFPQNPEGAGLKPVIKDQADKVAPSEGGKNPKGDTYEGYVPGLPYISPNANLDFKPTLSELVNGVPTACHGDPKELSKKFYSGAWYIATVNIFHGKNSQNPNAFLGLQSLLKIADDNPLGGGGGGEDTDTAYAGLNIESPVNPQALFG